MPDDMYFTNDERSMYRGKRIAKRTETVRPCLVQTLGDEGLELKGVVMDITPFGMLIRIMESVRVGTELTIQLMRGDQFREAFSSRLRGTVVRHDGSSGGFTDHGVRLHIKEIPRAETRPIIIEEKPPAPRRAPTRMHTIDHTIGGLPKRRSPR